MIAVADITTATDDQLRDLLQHLTQRAERSHHGADYRLAMAQAQNVRDEIARRRHTTFIAGMDAWADEQERQRSRTAAGMCPACGTPAPMKET